MKVAWQCAPSRAAGLHFVAIHDPENGAAGIPEEGVPRKPIPAVLEIGVLAACHLLFDARQIEGCGVDLTSRAWWQLRERLLAVEAACRCHCCLCARSLQALDFILARRM
eukprot:3292371-Amphidinium_carterae.1